MCKNLLNQTEQLILENVRLLRAGLPEIIKDKLAFNTREGPELDSRFVKSSNFFYPETSQLSFSNHIVGFV